MDVNQIIQQRGAAIYAELRDAEAKYKAAVKELRARRDRLMELRSRRQEIYEIHMMVEKASRQLSDEDQAFLDSDVGASLSELLRAQLTRYENGLNLAQIVELSTASGVKKSTISTTLYNMKKRNEIEHNETTGVYRMIRRNMPSAAKSFPK